MTTEPPVRQESGQAPVIAFLSDPGSFDPVPDQVEIIQTHGAFVFLAGDAVYKIKRAVAYDYMDCSTLDKREALCRRELSINQPTAPQIYRDVIPITRQDDGRLAFDGAGTPVEWAVHMVRFSQDCILESLAERGALDAEIAGDLGDTVARLHDKADRIQGQDGHQLCLEIVDELERVFADHHDVLGSPGITEFDTLCRRELHQCRDLLRQRAENGFVRRCHGDLHLRNLVMLDGRVVPFDALEFDERLATTDILYDLAFLLMDLLHRDLAHQANVVFNRYLSHSRASADLKALAALPLFLGLRAGIRAMVSAQSARLDKQRATQLQDEARLYLQEALRFLDRSPPSLIAVGGLSGTGKSVLAAALAPTLGNAPGALHLRSDVERKRLFGVDETTKLEERHYTREISREVYDILLERARTALEAGHSVVLDAVYQNDDERGEAEDLAACLALDFHGLWLQADLDILINRVNRRIGDASDADAMVVKLQADRPIGPMRWPLVDAGGTKEETLERAWNAIAASPAVPPPEALGI